MTTPTDRPTPVRAVWRAVGRGLLALGFAALGATGARAQVESAPVGHPVYEFLSRLSSRGVLTGYAPSVLPLRREEITAALERLGDATLSPVEQRQWASFAADFLGSDDAPVGWRIAPGREPLWRWRDSTRGHRITVQPLGAFVGRAAAGEGGYSLTDGGLVFSGTLGGRLGFRTRATNGLLLGDRRAARRAEPTLNGQFNLSVVDEPFFDRAEAAVTLRWRPVALTLGRERLIVGGMGWNAGPDELEEGPTDPTTLWTGTTAPRWDHLRLQGALGPVRFDAIHGSLLGPSRLLVDSLHEGGVPVHEPKWIALHRLQLAFGRWGELGLTESVIYGERGVELAYLNPLMFYKSAEHALDDRDNSFLGGDLTLRPWRGGMLFGSLMIDDVGSTDLGGRQPVTRSARQVAARQSGWPLTDGHLAMRYTRIDPFVYSHRVLNNAHANQGYGLGADLLPNSDRIEAELGWWPESRLWLLFHASHTRHGAGMGGDLSGIGATLRPGPAFLADSLETSTRISLLVELRPARRLAVRMRVGYRWQDATPTTGDGLEWRFTVAVLER